MVSRGKLLGEIENRKEELINLCCDLIRINTENPPCKTGLICEYIGKYLTDAGISYNTYEPDPGKMSIVGILEGKTDKNLIFNGHLDVVPPGDLKAWQFEPFSGVVDNGKICGRGSADMKTKIASAMFVAKILKGNNVIPGGSITLMFTADEETGGVYGTKYLIEKGLVKGDACVIGESAGRDIGVADKGCIHFKLKTYGKTAHAARRFEGDNAIEKISRLILKLTELENIDLNLPDSYLEIVEKTLPYYEKRSKKLNIPFEKYRNALVRNIVNCGVIKGGVKRNVVPDFAEAEFDLRFPPGIEASKIEKMIRDIVNSSNIDGVEIEFLSKTESSYQPQDCDIFRAAKRAIYLSGGEKEPLALVKTSITDALHTRKAGIPTIILGHDGSGGHVPNEYSEVEEVLFTTRVYLNTIFEYFNM